MFCRYCGKEHSEESLFCSYCGEQIKEKEAVKRPAKCWRVFANTAKALGIVTLATCWIPFLGLYSLFPGIPGIVFGVLGKYGKEEPYVSSARKGFIMSLIGTILCIPLFFIFVFLIAAIA